MKRILTLFVAVLLAVSLGIGTVGATEHTDTRTADIQIEQPHYVEGDVTETTDNGTTVYEATGPVLDIYPQAFDPEDVVDYGVEPEGVTLTAAPGGYELQADQEGTVELYWVVEEQTTSGNQTTSERVRYEAVIRVNTQYDEPVVMSQTEVDSLKEDANRWEELNSTVQSQMENSWVLSMGSSLPFLPESTTAMDYIQAGLDKQQAIHNPGAAFGAGLTLLIFGLFSIAGVSISAGLLTLHAKIVGYLKGKLNLHELTEDAEGEAAKRLEAGEIKYNKISFQNDSFDDVYLPHIADGMRSLGETPLEASTNLDSNALMPSVCAAFEAQAMGLDDYFGVVPEDDLAADGGEKDDSTDLETEEKLSMLRERDAKLEIVPEDDVPDGATTVDLTEADRDWLDVLPVNEDPMHGYDPVEAEIDRSSIEVGAVSWDLESIIEQIRLDMRHFENKRVAGGYLRDFLEDVVEHPITDPEGRPRTCRMVLETLLRDAQVLNDRYNVPKEYQIEVIQAAIADDDPLADGLKTVEDIEQGKYA
jgi:hypothetical protein